MPGDPKQQRTVGPGTGLRRVFHALGLVAKTWMGLTVLVSMTASAEDPWLSYKGGAGPGKGKKIVFVTGDEEYRSEESMPAMARILAKRHGFDCTVLFAIDPKSGEIDPKIVDPEDVEALEDLILSAVRSGFQEAVARREDKMKEIMPDMPDLGI